MAGVCWRLKLYIGDVLQEDEEAEADGAGRRSFGVVIPANRKKKCWPEAPALQEDTPKVRPNQKRKDGGALCIRRLAYDVRSSLAEVFESSLSVQERTNFHDSASQVDTDAPFLLRNGDNEMQVADFDVVADIVRRSPEQTRDAVLFYKVQSTFRAESVLLRSDGEHLLAYFGEDNKVFLLPTGVPYWAVVLM